MFELLQIDISIGLVSFALSGLLAVFVLLVFLVGNQNLRSGWPFLLLILATLTWGFLAALSQAGVGGMFDLVMVAEIVRYFTWMHVLLIASGFKFDRLLRFDKKQLLGPANITILTILALLSVVFNRVLVEWTGWQPIDLHAMTMMIFAVIGLVMVEQLFRNTPGIERWSINYLCISAGVVFVYDFFVYSNAFLVHELDYEFWSARGLVNALIMPAIVLAASRNPQLVPNLHVSRTFVFHSTTLVGTGAYLLLMSVAGFYIRESSGEWGKVLQATFLFIAMAVLAALFVSQSLKTRIKRYLVYSFRNKYDYREEWSRFSQTLLAPENEESINQRAIKAIAQIVESSGGTLWIKENHRFVLTAEYMKGLDGVAVEAVDSPLSRFLKQHESLFSQELFAEYAQAHDASDHWFLSDSDHWLIVPLWVSHEIYGFVHLRRSIVGMDVDIEDEDLLSIVAHHTALSLSLKDTDRALQQARQFKEVSQMTSFLVHDLKTVLSQLALMVENARLHKNNPDFVDDMVNTLEHVTAKMQRLVSQLKSPQVSKKTTRNNLLEAVKEVLQSCRATEIKPEFEWSGGEKAPFVQSDRENLLSAIKHLVQNAIESCATEGWVKVRLFARDEKHVQLSIEDNGEGMTREFIAERLFQPFDSTKGVSGMGVGVYQSRSFFRSLGGEITVESEPGKGSKFIIQIPVIYD